MSRLGLLWMACDVIVSQILGITSLDQCFSWSCLSGWFHQLGVLPHRRSLADSSGSSFLCLNDDGIQVVLVDSLQSIDFISRLPSLSPLQWVGNL